MPNARQEAYLLAALLAAVLLVLVGDAANWSVRAISAGTALIIVVAVAAAVAAEPRSARRRRGQARSGAAPHARSWITYLRAGARLGKR